MEFGMIELSIRCPRCDSPLHLNGVGQMALCESCKSEVDIPDDYWKGILGDMKTDLADLEEGEGTNSNIFGTFNTNLLMGRLYPYCPDCKTDLELDDSYQQPSEVPCPDCGTLYPVQPTPQWLAAIVPSIRLIVNAVPIDAPPEAEPSGGPVALFCPQCGGSLVVDGTKRLVPCSYCDTSVYLPDDLWLRLHPAKTKRRWFVGFESGRRRG